MLATKVNDTLVTTGGAEARVGELISALPGRSWRRLPVGAGAHGPREWLAEVFAPDATDSMVDALDSQELSAETTSHAQAKARPAGAGAKLRRLQAAIEAGIDPAAMVEPINRAQAERAAARAELDHAQAPTSVERAEVYAMVDSLADIGTALSTASPER